MLAKAAKFASQQLLNRWKKIDIQNFPTFANLQMWALLPAQT